MILKKADMRLKDFFDTPCGIRFMFNNLNTCSSIAKRHFASGHFLNSADKIESGYEKIIILSEFIDLKRVNSSLIEDLKFLLRDIKEVSATLERLSSSTVLDDIELFEIKYFAILSEKILDKSLNLPKNIVSLYSLNEVVRILDPDNTNSLTFYIYDSYSEELTEARRVFKNDAQNFALYDRTLEIEESIRIELSDKLRYYINQIKSNYISILNLDILIAKVLQNKELGLCIPSISESGNSYVGLFNPEVEFYLKQSGKEFNRVDFESGTNLTLLTGANMGGKTVLLKTLALSHILFHYCMGIPAKSASIMPVDEVFLMTGDDQDTKMGYSSFSAEVLRISSLLSRLKEGAKILTLIDEPARSTNPFEGSALVTSLINRLEKFKTESVITTHYNISNTNCKRLRVRGLIDGVMDYTLIEDVNNEAPKEAINIAKTLGADDEWINDAEKLFNESK